MKHGWVRRGVVIGFALLFGLAGAAWADVCGDTSGPGGTDLPCGCGDSVTTDTRLNDADPVVFTGPGDTVCPEHGLLMETAGVRLNLGGREIHGDGGRNDAGVLISADDVEVRNGDIKAFGKGVATGFGTTSGSMIRNLRIRNSTQDGIVVSMTDGFVVSNRASQNGASGILVVGTGNDIDRNQARNNFADGICVMNPGGAPNVDTGRNVGRGNGAIGNCLSQCEIDGEPCLED